MSPDRFALDVDLTYLKIDDGNDICSTHILVENQVVQSKKSFIDLRQNIRRLCSWNLVARDPFDQLSK